MTRKLWVAAAAAAMAFNLAGAAQAGNPVLPGLTNLNFTSCNGGAACVTKQSFTGANLDGWSGGSGLIFLDSPIPGKDAAGPVYLTTYANPVGSISGNYVEADGNPTFESGFQYQLHNLTPGTTYSLSFYQGASQQLGFGGTTTNRWIVSLGTQGMQICYNCGGVDPTYGQTSTYFNNDPTASVAATPLMTVLTGDAVGWNYVTVNLTADSADDVLSFLAWGDNGSTVNLPPMAFLSGVNSPPGLGVPEPAVWTMMVLGLLALGGAARRERARRAAVA